MKFIPVIAAPLLMIVACSAPMMKAGLLTDGETIKPVFLVHDHWHAALIIRKADLPEGTVPERDDFPAAEYLELSWGDQDYFPAIQAGIGLTLRAAFWSRGSVLHVLGFKGGVKDYFPHGEVIEIALSPEAFGRLSEFVSSSFSRSDPSIPAQAQPGLVPHSRFYPATGRFSILRTCNTWAAEALKSAGLNITPAYVITAASLARQVRPHSVSN